MCRASRGEGWEPAVVKVVAEARKEDKILRLFACLLRAARTGVEGFLGGCSPLG